MLDYLRIMLAAHLPDRDEKGASAVEYGLLIAGIAALDYFRNMLAMKRDERDERGASAVEYGLLVAGIAALIVTAVFALGPIVKESFTDTCDSLKTGNTGLTATADCTP